MTRQVELISIFLASPGDVAEERQLARDVIDEINRTTGRDRSFRLEVTGWDTDSFASYGNDGQSLINDQIGQMEDYELFVGILWNRFGSPTPRADSGTEEEFNRAEESHRRIHQPNIMFYFCQRPTNLRNASEINQKGKILAFKERVQEGGLTVDYVTASEFQAKFRHDLSRWLVTRTAVTPDPPAVQIPTASLNTNAVITSAIPAASKETNPQIAVSDSGMWVLLGSGFFEAESVEEKNDSTIAIGVISRNAEEDAVLKQLQVNQQRHRESLPYAHQNAGGIVQVLNADRKSVSGKSIWSLTLKIESNDYGFMSEMSYNGISSEQIAEMRARLILLNEMPQISRNSRGDVNHGHMVILDSGSRANTPLQDSLLRSIVSGIGTRAKIQNSALPDL